MATKGAKIGMRVETPQYLSPLQKNSTAVKMSVMMSMKRMTTDVTKNSSNN